MSLAGRRSRRRGKGVTQRLPGPVHPAGPARCRSPDAAPEGLHRRDAADADQRTGAAVAARTSRPDPGRADRARRPGSRRYSLALDGDRGVGGRIGRIIASWVNDASIRPPRVHGAADVDMAPAPTWVLVGVEKPSAPAHRFVRHRHRHRRRRHGDVGMVPIPSCGRMLVGIPRCPEIRDQRLWPCPARRDWLVVQPGVHPGGLTSSGLLMSTTSTILTCLPPWAFRTRGGRRGRRRPAWAGGG